MIPTPQLPKSKLAAIALQKEDACHRQASANSRACRLAVIMTSHNRREKTLECLKALGVSAAAQRAELSGVLVDDGSTDGTAEAVGRAYPWMRIVLGDGSLFWCRGMHRAFETALECSFDYYLWLNDDTMLYEDALSRLLDCAEAQRACARKPVIVVGSTLDKVTGRPTYGGERRQSGWRRSRFVLVQPSDSAQRCDSMDGNIVLIPADAARLVGNLDPMFEHAMGDTDYGLRASKLGVEIWVAPGVHGTCALNPVGNTFVDPRLPFLTRWRLLLSRKGLPWRSWLTFTRRHTGICWPLFFLWPYARTVMSGAVHAVKTTVGKRRHLL